MGKNTLIKKAIKSRLSDHPEWEQILPYIQQNVGLVLTKGSLSELRDKLIENIKPAPVKIGIVAPDDIIVKKQVTTLEPTKTSFFASLNIATKITRSFVEILNDVKICEKGKKVGSSEATLLQMLDIKPFSYGPKIIACFNGSSILSPNLIDFTESQLFELMSENIDASTVLSLAQTYPNLIHYPKVILGGFHNLIAVTLGTNYNFKEAEGIKKCLDTIASLPVVQQKTQQSNNSTSVAQSVTNNNNNNNQSDDDPDEPNDGDFFNFFGDGDNDNPKKDNNCVDDEDVVDIEGFF